MIFLLHHDQYNILSLLKIYTNVEIIKFAKEKSSWFTVWDNNIIKRWNGQTCTNVIAMRTYISQFFSIERRQNVIDLYDLESFRYATLVDKTYFESELKKIRK